MKEYQIIKIFFLLLSFILFGCSDRTPIINSDSPFIVEQIECVRPQNGCNMSIYYGRTYDMGKNSGLWFETAPAIILPTRMFQVGDTIVLERKVNKLKTE